MDTPYWLALLATVLAMCADKTGRDRLAWLVVGSVVGPMCAALTLLMLGSIQEPSCPDAT